MVKLLKNKPSNTKILALKVKTESNNLGLLKTLIVTLLIFVQLTLIILSTIYMMTGFKYYTIIAMCFSFIASVHVLSSHTNGQTKATWIFLLLFCFSFGYIIYLLSNEKILFGKARKKYKKIYEKTNNLLKSNININTLPTILKQSCNYLNNSGFVPYKNCNSTYFSSGSQFFDNLIEDLKKAEDFIFIEYYIITDGILLSRISDILLEKSKQGVDIRIIYDDMGSHSKLSRKTKKKFKSNGIKLNHFNRFTPIFNLALNLRNHRKIVVIDGKVAYTGGANLADEYINEKQIYGYWKDAGIKIEGKAIDTFTISFLRQWEFIIKEEIYYKKFINKSDDFKNDNITIPFVSGPEFSYSIARDVYINLISSAQERLYIMSPYFIPEETITNLLINKAKSGVDVKLIIPGIADKKFVYVVSRDYAERLISNGIQVFTMTNSFVHSKVVYSENSAVVGSINMDLRSFHQQFESAVYTTDTKVLSDILTDFNSTLKFCSQITKENRRRNKIIYRIFACIFRLMSPLM